jgi:parallel beta-helix repeat protein
MMSMNGKLTKTVQESIVLLLLAFLFTNVLSGVSVKAAAPPPVINVSPTGSDATGNGSPTNPYATPSHAVSVASAGSIIMVAPGMYNDMVTITKKVILKSNSSEPSDTIINAAGKPNGIVAYGSSAAGTIIEGFTVENADNHGIYVQDSYKVIITNNVVKNNGLNVIKGLGEDKAIQLTGVSNSTVSDNRVIGNLYGGIGVADDGSINSSWNLTAVPSAGIPAGQANPGSDNIISANAVLANTPNHCSIVISAYNQGEGVANNIISGNVVVGNTAGVIVAADTPNTVAVNNKVLSNTIENNGEAGVVVHSNAGGDVVSGNIISGNILSADGSGPKIIGIIIGGEGPVAVQNTTITNNIIQDEYFGIQIVNGKQTFVGGNDMVSVEMPINGTVTELGANTMATIGAQAPLMSGVSFETTAVVGFVMVIVGFVAGLMVLSKFAFPKKPEATNVSTKPEPA